MTTATVGRVLRFLEENGRETAAGASDAVPAAPRPAGSAEPQPEGQDSPQNRLPILRQPPEVPRLRQHLLGEMGGRRPRRDGARPRSSPAAGAPGVRRRHGGWHRAHRRDAPDAPALPHAAVLYRRQGDQPGGRAPRAGADAGPVLRASSDGSRADQPLLHRGALADAALDGGRGGAQLDRGRPRRRFLARVPRADHRPPAPARRDLAGPPLGEDGQPALCAPFGAGGLSRGPQVPARPGDPAARRGKGGLRPGHRLAALPRADAGLVQGAEGARAARPQPRARRAAAGDPFAGAAIPGSKSSARCGRARTRSPPIGTNSSRR